MSASSPIHKALCWSATENEELLQLSQSSSTGKEAPVACSGNFPNDFRAACQSLGVIPHPKVMACAAPSAPAADKKEGQAQAEAQGETGQDEVKPSYEEVTVHGWKLDLGSARALALVLPQYPTIHTLKFFNAGLTPAVVDVLVEALSSSRIQKVYVDFNTFANEADTACLLKLAAPGLPIRLLSLRSNGISDQLGAELFNKLRTNSNIVAIDLWRNHLADTSALALADTLCINKTLMCLNLSKNAITDAGVSAIASSLVTISVDNKADIAKLKERQIPVVTAKGKSTREGNTTVCSLNLSENPIHDQGCQALLNALQQAPTLANVYLQHNFFSTEMRVTLRSNPRVTLHAITHAEEEEESAWRYLHPQTASIPTGTAQEVM